MNLPLDAQTVRDAEQIEMALKRAAGWRPHVRDDREDAELCAVVLADALAGLVASVEALTSERDQAREGLRVVAVNDVPFDGELFVPPAAVLGRLVAAEARVVALTAERDAYRIDADCAMRDCDALDLRLGIAVDALRKIEDRRQGNGATPRGLAAIARAALDAEAALPDAERKQELGGDGLGAVTVAQETTAGVAPLRPLHERVTRVADWLEWPPHGTFRRGRGVAQFKIRDLREAANALAASATSPAHRRGAPEDALSPEEERDALAEMLEGAYEDCERAEARLLSLEEALRDANQVAEAAMDAHEAACSRTQILEEALRWIHESATAPQFERDRTAAGHTLFVIAGRASSALAASVGDKERQSEDDEVEDWGTRTAKSATRLVHDETRPARVRLASL